MIEVLEGMPQDLLVLAELKLELGAFVLNFLKLLVYKVKLAKELKVLRAEVCLALEHVAQGVVYLLFVGLHLLLVFRDHFMEG